ncbi:MAG: toll/interleukin-1 receptor domain-containing protein [Mycobacterium sp.]
MALTVFISHAAPDADVASALQRWIEEIFIGGIRVFVSGDGKSITPGADWRGVVEDSLRQAGVVLVVCTETSLSRPWVGFEAGAGWMNAAKVVPLCYHGIGVGDLPLPFSARQGLDLEDQRDQSGLLALLAREGGFEGKRIEYRPIVLPPRHHGVATLKALDAQQRNVGLDRPQLVLEKAYVVDETLGIQTKWDDNSTITTSGTVAGSGHDPGARMTRRARPAQVARMRIRNLATTAHPSGQAKKTTARLRFVDETGDTVVDVPSARWTEAPAVAFPASRTDVGRMDFGIGESHNLDVAFKYCDSTVPYALDNEVIVATPNWESFAYALSKGRRWTVLVDLGGDVRETLRGELRLIRDNEGHAGRIEFRELSAGTQIPNSRAELEEALRGVLGEINHNLTIKLPNLFDRSVSSIVPEHGHLDVALAKAGGFPLAVHDPVLNDALVELRRATNALFPDAVERSLVRHLYNPYPGAAKAARDEIVRFLNGSP